MTLTYSPDSWAIGFYKSWIERGVWSLEEAAKLYLGSNPHGGREFIPLGNVANYKGPGLALFTFDHEVMIGRFDETGELAPTPSNRFEDESSLELFVKKHIAAGNLKIAPSEGLGTKIYFRPEELATFFDKFFPLTPPPQSLFDVLGIKPLSRVETQTEDARQTKPSNDAPSEYGPCRLYYEVQIHKGLWTLNEAVPLYIGHGPKELFPDVGQFDQQEIRQIDLQFDKKTKEVLGKESYVPAEARKELKALNSLAEWAFRNKDTKEWESLHGWLTRHTILGQIHVAGELNGEKLYLPKDIVRWLRDITGQKPFPVLSDVLFEKRKAPVMESFGVPPLTEPIIHTGDPGRPSVAHIYFQEFERRCASGIEESSLAAESRFLHKWIKENYNNQNLPLPTVRTIENRIRDRYRQVKAARN